MRARESACRPPGSSLAIGLGYVPPLVACSSTPWWAVVLPLHSHARPKTQHCSDCPDDAMGECCLLCCPRGTGATFVPRRASHRFEFKLWVPPRG
jgi:hypothetical protein